MDFVVRILVEIFKCTFPEAMEIMLEAHNSWVALVSVMTLEEAEFRVDQAHGKSRAAEVSADVQHRTGGNDGAIQQQRRNTNFHE